MTITGIRSVCPPNNPSMRATDKGIGKKAHVAVAILAGTPTPCGMNVRISERACPSGPPINSNGKIGPPSKPVANGVLVSKFLVSTSAVVSLCHMEQGYEQLVVTGSGQSKVSTGAHLVISK